ncbi:MAG: ribonuclease Z, partial [Candidatus Bathyarchaeia archaeon]
MPTPSRGAAAVAVRRKGEVLLFDCGEGTQQRMVAARIGFRRPMRIFISHLHGDHVLGLPGLLQTMTLLRRERPLQVYGPRGLVDFIKAFSSVLGGPGFPLEVHEIVEGGAVFAGSEYRVEAAGADHDVECWSYALVEHPRPGRFHPERARALGVPEGPLWKRLQHGGDVTLGDGRTVKSADVVEPPRRGRKIAYSGDTRPSEALIGLARGADLLIHEATFDDALAERAAEDGHSTASQAAEVAAAARVGMLILTHISSRYPDHGVLLEQARKIFPETRVAEDLMEIEVPL